MTKTINGLTVTTSAAAGDFVPIWRASNADTRKITKANFMGGVLTGAGTIATGGFTLTVPATGSAALLATANVFTAEQYLNGYYAGGTTGPGIQAVASGIVRDKTPVAALANDAVLQIGSGTIMGLMIVNNSTGGGQAMYWLTDGNAPSEISDRTGSFTPTKDNAGTLNIYFETGSYRLQNKVGSSQNISVRLLTT